MKVRILSNSFRFRLKEHELLSFKEHGRIEEIVSFGASPSDCLSFCLEVKEDENFGVSFHPNVISFYLPAKIAENWTLTNQVGIQAEIDTGDNRKMRLLVEKDFKCKETCAEENAGAFEQPFH